MSTSPIIQRLLAKAQRTDIPNFRPGDTVRVQVKIKEGDKERLQAFEGTVISKNNVRFEPYLQTAVDEALNRLGKDARVLVLPEAANTLPMPKFHTFPELESLVPEPARLGGLPVAAG